MFKEKTNITIFHYYYFIKRGDAVKEKKTSLILFLSSFIYAIQFYINNKIAPVGDQIAFLKYAKEFKFNYLLFGLDRYFTWSSRLLIESATLFFSVHEKFIIFAAFGATILLLIASIRLAPQLPWLPALLIFIFFPATEFLSAGSIPTYVNYIFPASFLIFSLLQKDSPKNWIKIPCFIFFAFAVMQEQLAVYAFLWLGFELITSKKDRISNGAYFLLSILGILSAKLSPGNGVRFGKEVATWFPNFSNLNIFQKVGLGFLETGDKMLSVSFPFVILFLVVLLIYAIQRKNIIAISLSGFVLFNIFSQKFEFNNLFGTLSGISKAARESGTFSFNITYLSAIGFYGLLLLMILYSMWLVIPEMKERIWLIYLFVIGLAGRMFISLSPTLYASNTRTFLPLMFSLFIITCKLLYDVYIQCTNGKKM